jgi:hypothetical protein
MAHVWLVEVRIRPTLMNGGMGPWTAWNPMDTSRPGVTVGEHWSVPNAFHGKKLAEWECRECRKQALPRKHVEYRVTRYDR